MAVPRLPIPRRVGLRWKLSAAIAAVSALVALVLSLIVHNAARVSMISNSRDVQDERIQSAQRIYESNERLAFGAVLDDPSLPEPLLAAVNRGERATYVSEDGAATPEVWAATPLPDGGVLSLRTRFTDRYSVLADLDRTLVIGSVTVVLGSTALGVLIGGRLSRRLRKAATAAGRVAEGDAEVRVREAIGGRAQDEADELARAIDAMADALQARLEAERRVTADIAHELRTPVTGLLTAAELLPEGRPSEMVRDRAQVLRVLVEDILEVARLDGPAERAELQDVALGEFVTRRVRDLDPGIEVHVEQDAVVTTDPRRLERVLGNLLANAARHGEPPVEVTVDNRLLRVRDHGPGFPATLLAEGPSRFRTGSTDRAGRGHGLGLTIAAGQARVLGARLTFRNTTPGAVAILRLPETAPADHPCPPRHSHSGPPHSHSHSGPARGERRGTEGEPGPEDG
ncbi:two-component system sensor histidine kinase CseC [Streptomyces sp. 549]|uniref:two-component system sensor histidine kinase CseC n=1 Tax=Streptomyces sp. 549 TaxID=3049076 RepID=UPI0024C3C87F|nr:two-component system sensor histidine kinase CseC [Streptomyces sp. 549]MDK1472359.1 two-component system sensor histidine kinase CseC [Streptomyces sp. 549]